MANVGYRIFRKINRPDKNLVQGFAGIPVANIADCMSRLACIDARIRPLNEAPLLGTAFTVKTRPGDNLLTHKAIEMAEPGDILVIAAQGQLVNAILGELMTTWSQHRGIAGIIVDGAIRDVAALRKMTIPVYAAGVTPNGPYKDGPGEINVPVSCGGISINPGDILVGDSDSVVVINPTDAQRVLADARAVQEKETLQHQQVLNGTWDRSWIDGAIAAQGCEYVD